MLLRNNAACTRAGGSSNSKRSNHGWLPARPLEKCVQREEEELRHEELRHEERRHVMERRERAEGADDEGGEVGQNKVYSVGLGDLIKT